MRQCKTDNTAAYLFYDDIWRFAMPRIAVRHSPQGKLPEKKKKPCGMKIPSPFKYGRIQ